MFLIVAMFFLGSVVTHYSMLDQFFTHLLLLTISPYNMLDHFLCTCQLLNHVQRYGSDKCVDHLFTKTSQQNFSKLKNKFYKTLLINYIPFY